MPSHSRVILKDFYGQPAQFYHATFDHLTHHKDARGRSVPTVLLKNIYSVDSNDSRIFNSRQDTYKDSNGNSIIADHCWMDIDESWFKLPKELFKGDEIFFKAEVEQYNISRDDLVEKRNQIWQTTQQLNDSVFSAWKSSKNNYHGAQYRSALSQMKAHIKQNNHIAHLQQERIPLVDYSLTHPTEIRIAKLIDTTVPRAKYNLSNYQKFGIKYTQWLSKRSFAFLNIISKDSNIEQI